MRGWARAASWCKSAARRLAGWLPWRSAVSHIDAAQWQKVLSRYDFLSILCTKDQLHLQTLVAHFLASKEFSGAHGLQVTDDMALCIAAQACLPLLHIAPRSKPRQALAWYADFVGIVVHPGAMRARRSAVDAAGVAQFWSESITGEAMQGGPVTLSWQDAAGSNHASPAPYNVVIHEFAHVMDMRNGMANGCPELPHNFCGLRVRSQAARHWQTTLTQAYETQQEAVSLHERFGAPAPLLDAYACTNPAEFFAVATEAYFTQRGAFGAAHPALLVLFDGFFKP